MFIVSVVLFVVALLGLCALFVMRHVENTRGITFKADIRAVADARAEELKKFLARSRYEAIKLVPKSAIIMRYLVHKAALAAAHFARFMEKQAHRLADMASHKHHFEAHETRSDFLKQVSDYKRH
jgi:hypothetical protein